VEIRKTRPKELPVPIVKEKASLDDTVNTETARARDTVENFILDISIVVYCIVMYCIV
jgi:hypothetical protein